MQVLAAQNEGRVPWLVPLRHARMQVSPFAFYRATAELMAGDLAGTPTSGIAVQLGGDAHLSNFGAYASPSRRLVFDANDFDETLPGPWEWDVKRLATSFTILGEYLGFDGAGTRRVTKQSVASYRAAIRRFARLGHLDLWYERVDVDELRMDRDRADLARRRKKFSQKSQSRTSMQALDKLAEEVDGRYRIRSDHPVLFPLRELPAEYDAPALERLVYEGFERYKETLSDDRHTLLDRFTPIDVGVKVVGVGSVGTRCFVMLLEGLDRSDPLFLQMKEAGDSVLEAHLGPSEYRNSGRRVVEGQRLTQAESDILLGWTEGGLDHHDYYVRQLRDWKGSVVLEGATPDAAAFYADLCGSTLARGHARSGDAVAIAAYLGKSDDFDRAIVGFAAQYVVQNQRDYDAFMSAISDGTLEVESTTA